VTLLSSSSTTSSRLWLFVGDLVVGLLVLQGELLRVFGLCLWPSSLLGSCSVLCSRAAYPLTAVRCPFELGRRGRVPIRSWRRSDRQRHDHGVAGPLLLWCWCFPSLLLRRSMVLCSLLRISKTSADFSRFYLMFAVVLGLISCSSAFLYQTWPFRGFVNSKSGTWVPHIKKRMRESYKHVKL
jgi:hypothetical protein